MNENVTVGRNAVLELLRSGKAVDKIFMKSGTVEGSAILIVAEAKKRGVPIVTAERTKLDEMADGVIHQGVAAVVPSTEYATLDDVFKIAEERGEAPFILIADEINDPGNLGAIIRNCEGAGVHGVIIPKRNSATVTAAAVKASAGAVEHMAIVKVTNLNNTVTELKERGVWIVACEAGGQSYKKIDYTSPTAIILGSEDKGVSKLLIKNSDFVASIPMFGKVNSLNVSAAGAVVLFEAAMQRAEYIKKG